MHFGRFRLGLRTFKTGIAVFLVILIFQLLDRGNAMIAALSAVFSLRQDFETTVQFGWSRVLGNTLGGIMAVILFMFAHEFHQAFWVNLIILPILLMALIVFNDGINNNRGLIGSVAAYLMITLSVPAGQTYGYAFERVLDTFIGTFIAIMMNIGTGPATAKQIAKRIEDHMLQQHHKDER